MGRNRNSGLRNRGGIWHIDKQVLGHRIHESTGTSELKTAELMLARRIEQIRQASVFGIRPVRIFREAATRFLEENTHLVRDPRTGAPLYYDGTVREVTETVRRLELQRRYEQIASAISGCVRPLFIPIGIWPVSCAT